MPRRRQLSFEFVRILASRYASRSAFARADNSAYNAARHHGWLDDLFKDRPRINTRQRRLKPKKAVCKFWTLDRIKSIKAPSRGKLKQLSPNAYHAALVGGLLDEVFAEHPTGGYAYEGHRRRFGRGNRRPRISAEIRGEIVGEGCDQQFGPGNQSGQSGGADVSDMPER